MSAYWKTGRGIHSVISSPKDFRKPADSAQMALFLRASCLGSYENVSFYFLDYPRAIRDHVQTNRIFQTGEPGYCAYWSERDVGSARSVVQSQEAALGESERQKLSKMRARLTTTLDSISRIAEQDSVVLGQLVRFAVESRDLERADVAMARCAFGAAFCSTLRGFLALQRNQQEPEPVNENETIGMKVY